MKPTHSKTPIILLMISAGLLSLAAGIGLWRVYQAGNVVSLQSLIILPDPKIIADFSLVDNQGHSFSVEGFKRHWSLVFFGFTSCADVCPNTLYQLQQVKALMSEQEFDEKLLQIYLVSVDPERDTPQKMADYLSYFDPAFVGLSGEEPQLQALARQLGIAYFIEPHLPEDVEYNVDHSASILLLNPQAQLHGVLPAPHDSTSIAHDVMTAIRQERNTKW